MEGVKERFNALKPTEFVNLRDLEVGKSYSASDFKTLKTKYGNKVIVTLDDKLKIFLPQRYYNKFGNDEELQNLNCKLTYNGPVKMKNGNHFNDFTLT